MENVVYYSVVIPFHNRIESFEKSIESILNQTYPYYELILVNDHSDDETVDFAKKYSQKDSRVIVLHSEKRGAQAARNTGILNAKYDWIMFNDSDDEWMPEKLERYDKQLKEEGYNDRCVLYSDYKLLDEVDGSVMDVKAGNVSRTNSFREVLLMGGVLFSCLGCSKKLLNEIGMLDENVPAAQEWDTAIRLSEQGYFIKIPYASFAYHVNTGSSTFDSEKKNQNGHAYIFNKYKNRMADVVIDEIMKYPSVKAAGKIAVWGYGKMGQMLVNGFSRRGIDVFVVDSYNENAHKPGELKSMVGEAFVVVSMAFGFADIEEELKKFGYKEIVDYLSIGHFYSVHRITEMMVWST